MHACSECRRYATLAYEGRHPYTEIILKAYRKTIGKLEAASSLANRLSLMLRDKDGTEIFSGEPTHPGEMLADELEARGMTQKELAHDVGVSATFVSELIWGKKNVSLNVALKLEVALEIEAEFWINAQRNYNRGVAYLKAKNELKQLDLSPAKQKSLLQAVA